MAWDFRLLERAFQLALEFGRIGHWRLAGRARAENGERFARF